MSDIKMSDIKMSDVFDLPIRASEDFDDMEVEASISLDLVGKYAEAAVHSINNHDKLTQQVAELRSALLSIKSRQQVLVPNGFEFSSAWQIADKALKEGE